MKCFILFLALAVLSSSVIGTFHDKKVVVSGKKELMKTRFRRNYGRIEIVKPTISLDTQHVSGYGQQQQVVQQPIAMDTRVNNGYGQAELVRPVAPLVAAPVVSSGYGQQQQQAVQTIALERPVVASGYGQQQQQTVQTIALERPVVASGYGQQQQQAVQTIALERPVVSSGYGQQEQHTTIAMDRPVVASGYGQQQQQTVQTIALERPVVSSGYGQTATIALDNTVELALEPEYRNICLNRAQGSVFYLPHPTRPTFYIQCDEFGQAFLKECPANTIFTQNLVCEDVKNLLPIEKKPEMDQRIGSYGSVPQFSLDTTSNVQSSAQVEVIVEAPEFKNLCANRNAYGAATSSVFYVAHPTKQSFYIQCDEFGRAFLKECPANTIFTANLVCENVNDVHTVERETIVQQALDQASTGSYGSVPKFSQDAVVATQSQVEVVVEAPEFKELCLSKNAYGAPVSSVFYVAHPSDRRKYIQCNEFGNAYLKECPLSTVFTSNLVCEML